MDNPGTGGRPNEALRQSSGEVQQTPQGNLIEHEGGQTGFLAFTASAVDRKSGYVILTNSANGWKVFLDKCFVSLLNRIILE